MSGPKPRRQASSIYTAIRIVQYVQRCTVLILLILTRFYADACLQIPCPALLVPLVFLGLAGFTAFTVVAMLSTFDRHEA